ncbi:MAG: NlpC/P60 family protein [Gemmatimonadetes bacterium]|nr:NlpC/P60 family protein [Gemmatimonadota bacterium]
MTYPGKTLVRLCVTLALLGGASQARAQEAAPASSPASKGPFDKKPFAVFSASAQAMRDSLVAIARAQVGTKYVRGGTSPDHGFDCSGLVRYILGAMRLDMPRTARQQATQGLAVNRSRDALKPGDLLTFGKGKRGSVSHIGIYVGEGRYIHASSVAGRVIESALDRPSSRLIKNWRGVRRVVAADSAKKGDS